MSDNIKPIPSHHTDVDAFISELDGGVFKQKLAAAISKCAAGTMDFKKNGKLVVTLDMKKLGDSEMLEVSTTFSMTQPTMHGHTQEVTTRQTPFYVGVGGKLSIFPQDQDDMFNSDKKSR